MTREELLNMLTKSAKEYAPTAKGSIVKNRHMNELGETVTVTQEEVDALIAGFINFVGASYAVDYGLKASDLRK
jgi:hypothetical protein